MTCHRTRRGAYVDQFPEFPSHVGAGRWHAAGAGHLFRFGCGHGFSHARRVSCFMDVTVSGRPVEILPLSQFAVRLERP